ncbi:hypothetical protein Y032_0126g1356 [Ancylostoma ceylanicum]|uniref:Uncharacterized protein n=1 Tax=Ancylostoma ceylanicum TaxID=53326 RepID=A0A016T7V2_9BILA|nr:hypothetical protein Y032_0126g1356 [Ancylostoma ceylanicum]
MAWASIHRSVGKSETSVALRVHLWSKYISIISIWCRHPLGSNQQEVINSVRVSMRIKTQGLITNHYMPIVNWPHLHTLR